MGWIFGVVGTVCLVMSLVFWLYGKLHIKNARNLYQRAVQVVKEGVKQQERTRELQTETRKLLETVKALQGGSK